jgi:hypothetical protein
MKEDDKPHPSAPSTHSLVTRPITYYDNADTGVDLQPGKTKILFKARLDHGPGFSEETLFLIGPSECETYDVLWSQTDWTEDTFALAWLPRGLECGPVLWRSLLLGYWKAEEGANPGCRPNFSEIVRDSRSLASSHEIEQVRNEVWPGY